MKKLMIALAAVGLSVGAQAASVSWKTGSAIKAPTSATDGTFGTVNAGTGTLSLYVWIVDAATYDNATYASIGALDRTSATTSKTGFSGIMGGTADWNYSASDWTADANTTIYGLIVTTYTDGDITMFIANKATAVINGSGSASAVINLAKNYGGGTTGDAITGWTTTGTIPEPTSGLLMVLGLAGLALRRRRA